MKFELPELDYNYDSLEPYIDEQTMMIHHDKHHQGYANKLNTALEKHPEIKAENAEDLLKDLDKIPEDIRTVVRNNGGGYVNHNFFWSILKKDIELKGEIKEAIEKEFRNFEEFKKMFSEIAAGVFGSGWAWLVINDGELEIIKTSGHDNPVSEGKIPILVIDVWEHSYYLKYQNKRAEYIENFFKIINWDKVNEYFVKSKMKGESVNEKS